MGDIGKIVKSLSFIEEFVSVTSNLSTERDINCLLDSVIRSACKFSNCDGGRVYMLDVTRRKLELKASLWAGKQTNNDWYSPIVLSSDFEASLDGGVSDPLLYVMRTGQNLIVDNAETFSGLNPSRIYHHDQLNRVKTNTLIMVPLINHDRETIGVLQLINARDLKYSRAVSFRSLESIVNAFASQVAICINNTLLIDSNRRLIDLLDSSNQMLEEENRRLRDSRKKQTTYKIIGKSPAMKQAFSLMDHVVSSSVTVLLRGETGTGKEVFAREIHRHSTRSAKPFVTQNCAALPEQLLESELFGYKKGAFTGATAEKKGMFDIADGGTLFLDEIGDMPIALQSKLLRVLQENEIRPLGATQSHKVDVRIVAATHCDLEEKIKKGEFREDLFFRLSIFPIELPALRNRDNDILMLAEYFINNCEKSHAKKITGMSPAAVELMLDYQYPGNVRELQNIVERAVLLCECGGVILPEYLPETMRRTSSRLVVAQDQKEPSSISLVSENRSLKQAVNDFESSIIQQHLKSNNWNQTQTAKTLQIPRRTLIDKMSRFNIQTPEKRGR